VKKALGRCAQFHTAIVEHPQGTMPEGQCKHGHSLVEWAVHPGKR
jgi:hypothetical protein